LSGKDSIATEKMAKSFEKSKLGVGSQRLRAKS